MYILCGAAIPAASGGEAETTESNVKVEDRNRIVEYISAMRPIRQTSETFLQYIFCVRYHSLIWKSPRFKSINKTHSKQLKVHRILKIPRKKSTFQKSLDFCQMFAI
jgi:hypothetical protein